MALEAKARAYEEMSKGRGLPGGWGRAIIVCAIPELCGMC